MTPQTKIKKYEQLSTIEHLGTGDWREANAIVSQFTQDPIFIESLGAHNIDPSDKTNPNYMHALSLYAEDYLNARRTDELVSQDTQEQVLILANTPYFLHIQNELDYYELERRHRRLDDEEHTYYATQLKPYAIWYNQMTSDFIYSHPESKVSDINGTLSDYSFSYFPRRERDVAHHIASTTRGARTEAVTRMLLDETGVEYRAGTAADDMRGGDIVIHYHEKSVKVDLKSSQKPIAKLREDGDALPPQQAVYAIVYDRRDKGEGSLVLFPGFTDYDLGDNCQLDTDVANEKTLILAVQLQRAFIEMNL